MSDIFFGKNKIPRIYAYTENSKECKGLLKIGYTTKAAYERILEQYPIKKPGERKWNLVFDEIAIKEDGTFFDDHTVHKFLKERGVKNPIGEWFECDLETLKSVIKQIKNDSFELNENRYLDFKLRPEQKEAVEVTYNYFNKITSEEKGVPHFLWNAKMRFGKTFTFYKLVEKMNWKKVLILTFKPAVKNSWESDLKSHIDFKGWDFSKVIKNTDKLDFPNIVFSSFQDILGKKDNLIKEKNKWIHEIEWDCVVFDEYHYGAWRKNAKDLFESDDDYFEKKILNDLEEFNEKNIPIKTNAFLYLSGTPFKAISSGEFIEEQIYNWTYSDEQKVKREWVGENNPYEMLPQMILMTYQLPESVSYIADNIDDSDGFDINYFFKAEGENEDAKFIHEEEVQKWLEIIRGNYLETNIDSIRLGAKKPPFPFSDVRLKESLLHTFWFLPNVSSCYAMKNLLLKKTNSFFNDYKIILAAGDSCGIGEKAVEYVKKEMGNPLETKSITLSCMKLTTGVSIPPWSGIFMLRNTSSPETYFQAAFRVQTPWVVKNLDGISPNSMEILKDKCYIFDFSPNRALRQVADYSCRLNVTEDDPEKKVEEFINFLPILSYDGNSMKQIDAEGVLDIAMSGTTSTLLAKKWESALLVNVDNETLKRLMDNEEAMNALLKIEGFRSLNKELETILNKSSSISKLKQKEISSSLNEKEKKQLKDDEKEYKSKRKMIQEKLIKFATRVPIFMYLTDYREKTLKDVIMQLEPELFKKVTGLSIKDFELLLSLGVFNATIMNDAIYKFKRYEDSSLEYTGISKSNNSIGLWDTVISKEEFKN